MNIKRGTMYALLFSLMLSGCKKPQPCPSHHTLLEQTQRISAPISKTAIDTYTYTATLGKLRQQRKTLQQQLRRLTCFSRHMPKSHYLLARHHITTLSSQGPELHSMLTTHQQKLKKGELDLTERLQDPTFKRCAPKYMQNEVKRQAESVKKTRDMLSKAVENDKQEVANLLKSLQLTYRSCKEELLFLKKAQLTPKILVAMEQANKDTQRNALVYAHSSAKQISQVLLSVTQQPKAAETSVFLLRDDKKSCSYAVATSYDSARTTTPFFPMAYALYGWLTKQKECAGKGLKLTHYHNHPSNKKSLCNIKRHLQRLAANPFAQRDFFDAEYIGPSRQDIKLLKDYSVFPARVMEKVIAFPVEYTMKLTSQGKKQHILEYHKGIDNWAKKGIKLSNNKHIPQYFLLPPTVTIERKIIDQEGYKFLKKTCLK